MKTGFKLIVLLGILLLLVPAAYASTVASGNCGTAGHESDVKWILYDTGEFVLSGSGASDDYSYHTPWYDYRDSITAVRVSSGITRIGDKAFYYCENLEKLTIPASLKSMGEYAFSGTNINALYISDLAAYCNIEYTYSTYSYPYGLMMDGANLYLNSKLVTDLVIPSSVTDVQDYIFEGCESITSVTLGNQVKCGGNWFDCTNLKKIYVGDNVTYLHGVEGVDIYLNDISVWFNIDYIPDSILVRPSDYNRLFVNNVPVTEINVPYGTKVIDSYAYAGLKGITKITLPETVNEIDSCAFRYCIDLEEVNLPLNITEISDDTFYGCAALREISLPYALTTIGDDAFYNCSSLENIVLGDRVATIGLSAFYNCTALNSVQFGSGLKTISLGAFSGCDALHSVDLPEGITSVNMNGSGITEISIPKGVNTLYLSYCENLTKVTFEGAKPYIMDDRSFTNVAADVYYSSNNDSWTADTMQNYGGELTWIPYSGDADSKSVAKGECGLGLTWEYQNGTLTITGKGVMVDYGRARSELAPWASFNDELTNVYIGAGVSNIGSYAFLNHKKLANIVIPSTVTTIGSGAFESCSALTAINLPEGLLSLDSNVFWKCSALKKIGLPSTLINIGDGVFMDCTSLTTVSGSLNATSDYLFSGCEALTTVTLSSKVTGIATCAFSECESLTSITIPSGVTEIREGAFSNCGLTSVTIPSGVTTIQDYAFNSTPLTSVTIPASVKSIGKGAFAYTSLSNVTIPISVETIGNNAFEATALQSVTIPQNVTLIGKEAFGNIDALESVIFKCNLPTIGENAFYNEYDFDDQSIAVSYPKGNKTWTSIVETSSIGGMNVSGWKAVTFPDVPTPIDATAITLSKNSYLYDGTEKKPAVTIRWDEQTLKENTDYKLSYSNNINAGNASVTVTGIGKFTGSVKYSFSIMKSYHKVTFDKSTVTLLTTDSAYINPITIDSTDNPTVTYSVNNSCVKLNSTTGAITPVSVGTATVTVKLSETANYKSVSQSYTVTVQKYRAKKTLKISDVSFSFSNSASSFGYKNPHYTDIQYFYNVLDKKTADWLYYNKGWGEWGGYCYGMAVDSAFFNVNGSGLSLSDFGVDSIGALKPTMKSSKTGESLHDIIATSWVSQCYVQREYNLDNIVEILDDHLPYGIPCEIGFVCNNGHSIIAYRIEHSANKATVYVYNNNNPNKEHTIIITKDSSGHYTNWVYTQSEKYTSSNYYLCCTPYETFLAPLKNYFNGKKVAYRSQGNTLSAAAADYQICDTSGCVLAEVEDGELTSYIDGIQTIDFVSGDTDSAGLISLPTDAYKLVNTSDDTFSFTMTNNDQVATVKTESDNVDVEVIDETGTDMVTLYTDESDLFTIELSSSLTEDYSDVTFAGAGDGSTLVFGIKDGELVFTDCEGMSIMVNGANIDNPNGGKDISLCEIETEYSLVGYDGEPKTPVVYVYDGETELVQDTDYIVEYASNVEIGIATIGVHGIGSYGGSVFVNFEICENTSDRCAAGHNWNRGEVLVAPTPQHNGTTRFTCTICGAVEEREIANYAFELSEVEGNMMILLTNNTSEELNALYCATANDASDNVLSTGACYLTLGAHEQGALTFDAENINADTYKAYLLDADTYAPLRSSWTMSGN